MKQFYPQTPRTKSRFRSAMCLIALTGACLTLLPQWLYGSHTSHDVPAGLEVPTGNRPFLSGRAAGSQNYICLPSGSDFAWTFFGPQATLLNNYDQQIITHFLSSNPDEGGTARATWQHSRDTSKVWAMAIASSSDPGFVEPGAIPWLLLKVVGAEPGPAGGHRLTETTYLQRVRTSGGIAPTTGCNQASDVGKTALVPYTSDYIFYKAIKSE
jgi:hypothetical protein